MPGKTTPENDAGKRRQGSFPGVVSQIEAVPGPDRAMIYILAAWTGYRRAELASLTIRSFKLRSNPPSLTVPASYIVDSDGIIRHHFVNVDYTRRLEPDDLLQVLRGQ